MAYLKTRNSKGKVLFNSDWPCYVLQEHGQVELQADDHGTEWGETDFSTVTVPFDSEYPPMIFVRPLYTNSLNFPGWMPILNAVLVSIDNMSDEKLTFRITGYMAAGMPVKYYIFQMLRVLNDSRDGVMALWTVHNGRRVKTFDSAYKHLIVEHYSTKNLSGGVNPGHIYVTLLPLGLYAFSNMNVGGFNFLGEIDGYFRFGYYFDGAPNIIKGGDLAVYTQIGNSMTGFHNL